MNDTAKSCANTRLYLFLQPPDRFLRHQGRKFGRGGISCRWYLVYMSLSSDRKFVRDGPEQHPVFAAAIWRV